MKMLRVAFIAAGIAASVVGYSQTDTTKHPYPTDTTKPDKPQKPMLVGQLSSNPDLNNIDTPINNTITHKPNLGRHYIPVLGTYTTSTQSQEQNKNVTIQGDEQNPGKIWIEGLTTEKIYALRKPTQGVYKIPAQKEGDQNVAEGTVMYDDNSKEVRICIGHKFVDSDPAQAFNAPTEEPTVKPHHQHTTEKAAPVISFTGTKTDAGTAKL